MAFPLMTLFPGGPTFQLFGKSTNGVDELNPSLTINGTTVTPSIRYKGGDADGTNWDAWGYGETLDLQAGTAPSYNQGSPCFGTNDDSVKFNQGGWYEPTTGSYGNITTEDIVFEMVFKTFEFPATIDYVKKRGTVGYQVATLSNGTFTIAIDDGPNIGQPLSAALSPNTWYHMIAFLDRSGNAQIYINGTASGAPASLSAVGDISSSDLLMFGNDTDGPSQIAYFSMWKRDDWVDTVDAPALAALGDLAAERFNRLIGIHPNIARGTKLPTVQSRATEAYLDHSSSVGRRLYQVGDNWMRVVKRRDKNNNDIAGYLSENAGENEILDSENFASASWDTTRCGISSSVVVSPDGQMNGDGIVGDTNNNTHYVGASIPSTSDIHMFCVYAKAGDQPWLELDVSSVANANAYFDLVNGVTGTVGSAAEVRMSDWGNGWHRCLLAYTGGVPAHSHDIYPAQSDGDSSFAGDNTTINTYVWGASHHHQDYPQKCFTYIKTEGSIVTRVKDELRFKGDDGNLANTQTGSIVCNILTGDQTVGAGAIICDITDGGSDNEKISTFVGGNDIPGIYYTTAGATAYVAGTSDITDGYIHSYAASFVSSSLQIYIDGAQEGTTILGDIPDDLDRIDVGWHRLGNEGENIDGVISNLRIYDKKGVKK